MDAVDSVVDSLREFAKDSICLVKHCHKPDRKEFTKVVACMLQKYQTYQGGGVYAAEVSDALRALSDTAREP
ncbi:hypothetical protein OsJ_11348 [Oryza sativa Japonica Group]|uniref:Transport protein n=2 Tax=Oryza sativa subsp. japonica TaxID=39947 RepID=A0A979HJE1_ORYSJ|nr:putative transport protein [Oryza sativa Japonica Group]ABF96729.1 Protein transport protein SEC61 gamma subunit, putative [Oryza sativa Japonica Group]EAZ27400.1 hypothetical protein OsJ_11348 [Oryza sativa Japonica Group]